MAGLGKKMSIGGVFKDMASTCEDVRESDFYKGKLRVLEWINFYFAVVGSGSGIISCEIVFHEWDGYSSRDVDILNYISMFSSFFIAFTILFRYQCMLWYMRVKHFANKSDNLITIGLLKPCLYEIILNIVAPMPKMNEYHFYTMTKYPGTEAKYTVNTLLSYISMVRIYMLLRGLLSMTSYFSSRAERVCQMNGCKATYYFCIKCLMKEQPFSIMTYMTILVLFFGGYGLMIFERVLTGDYIVEDYINGMWCTVITMTTVGYGDFHAHTIFGRLTAVIICMVGVFLVSFVVVALTNLLSLTDGEGKALIILQRLSLKGEMRIYATKAINHLATRKILRTKYPHKTKDINNATRNYKENIRNFSFASRALKALAPSTSEIDLISKDLDEVRESMTDMLSKLDGLFEQIVEFPDQ